MFQGGEKRKTRASDGKPLPRIAELLVSRLSGTALEKAAWLAEQKAAGNLNADDPEEIAEAEALLRMLARIEGVKGRKQHLDALLEEGLKGTFPASDPISVGHFTGAEAWARSDPS
jgi:hypothetical protein